MKRVLSESTAELIADARVMMRLRSDREYVYAESSQAQALAEERIERQVWKEMEAEFNLDY